MGALCLHCLHAGAAAAIANTAVQSFLNSQDSVLVPSRQGQDPLEDQLEAFAGAAGGPPHHPWEAGLALAAGYAGSSGEPAGMRTALAALL